MDGRIGAEERVGLPQDLLKVAMQLAGSEPAVYVWEDVFIVLHLCTGVTVSWGFTVCETTSWAF